MTKTLLFIGDSITECGRQEDVRGIGTGYVNELYKKIVATDSSWEILNRGVGGDRITHLEERWERDVLSFNPDVLSISIGVNDVWHQLDWPEQSQVDPPLFEEVYQRLLQQVNPKTKLILMEPTIIQENYNSKGNQMLTHYAAIVRKLAKQYNAILVPAFSEFMNAIDKGDHGKLTTDGVHMTDEGNQLLAAVWQKAVPAHVLFDLPLKGTI
ncbi:SGNH/GDSL hydrolase family protein [Jeotgalibacillus sp. S-D1]|uniref:SGNH/GDSL hydrolase family protein n=1 Tax=Jeotgalibacillus sp. S-D1 TaxID=2552189 RepID=UPI001F0F4586|nr:SGNH/GDSL hydrolase family protein [Jeotgalibacillus sp. S-D1]